MRLPTKKRIAITEFGTSAILFIPFVLMPILAVVAIVELWPFYDQPNDELIKVALALVGPFLLFYSAGFWWINETIKAFQNGERLEGKIIQFDKPVGPYFAVTYEFEYLGERKVHRVAYINNQRTKKLAQNRIVSVLYNSAKKRSFIKEAYIE